MNIIGNPSKGFTLIELLIVVAIIAILSAIAVPNMLEAQTRAKVSRVKADLRALVQATESYRVDNVHYPTPSDNDGFAITNVSASTTPVFETKTSVSITTPISYMSTRLIDPFQVTTSDALENFHYGNFRYAEANADPSDEIEFVTGLLINPNIFSTPQSPSDIRYFFASHGPDNDHDEPDPAANPDGAASYDATNGTISNGDIYYWGSVGFIE